MKAQHTPGPWGTKESPEPLLGFTQQVFSNKVLAYVRGEDDNEAEANARLIASAPELLEALESLVYTATKLWEEVSPIKSSEVITVTHPIIEAAKEAIQKATGGQP